LFSKSINAKDLPYTILAVLAVIAVMKLASPVLVPLTVAFFIMLVLMPLVDKTASASNSLISLLRSRLGKPEISEKSTLVAVFSVVFVLLVFAIILMGAYFMVRGQIHIITTQSENISERIIAPLQDWLASSDLLGASGDRMAENLNTALNSLWELLPGAAGPIISGFLTFSLILFLATFLLLGSSRLTSNMEKNLPKKRFLQLMNIVRSVLLNTRRFIVTRIVTSIITGVGVGSFLLIWLTPSQAMLWGFVSFVLNMVPIYGSILAGSMAVLWTLSVSGLSAWPAAPGVLAINLMISNGLEPKLLDFRIPIGPVNILMGVIFWGWLWGGWGVLMAVPIMIGIKVMLIEIRGRDIITVLMET
jgi:AI-2 transport protein TqsA